MEENGYEKPHFWVWNRVGIWEQSSTPTKNSQGYQPRPHPAETDNKEENL